MCRSVPQIAVFSTLISTSLAPASGTATSSIQMPLAASRLTSAFIIWGMETLLDGGDPPIISAGTDPDARGSCAAGDGDAVLFVLQRAPAFGIHRPREVVALQPVHAMLFEPRLLRRVFHAF